MASKTAIARSASRAARRPRRSEHEREWPRSTAARSSVGSSPSAAPARWPRRGPRRRPRGRRFAQRTAEQGSSADPSRRLVREQRARALEQRRGRGRLAAVERTPPRTSRAAAPAARSSRSSRAAELGAELVRLLEVVADDLLVAREVAVAGLEPVGEARVQARAQLLRHRRVGDVADEHVVEAEAVVAREERAVGAHELLAPERQQRAADPGPVSSSSLTAPRWKRRPSTEPRCTTARSSGSSRSMRAASSAWIDGGTVSASGSSRKCASSCSTKSGLPSAVATTRSRSSGASSWASASTSSSESSWPSGSRTTSVAPGRGAAQDGRTSKRSGRARAEDEDRRVARRSGDVLDEVEQRRVGPVDVVDDEHERPLAREHLEQPPERPGGLVGRAAAVALADRAGDEPRREVAVPVAQRRAASRSPTSRTTSASGR